MKLFPKKLWLQGKKVELSMIIESTEMNPNSISFMGESFIDSQFAHGVGPLKETCFGGMIEERFYCLVG